jgi:hypothetical protein
MVVFATCCACAQHTERAVIERSRSDEPVESVLHRTGHTSGVFGGSQQHGVARFEFLPKLDDMETRLVDTVRVKRWDRLETVDPNDLAAGSLNPTHSNVERSGIR